MASANLFQQYLQPVKSMADYSDEMDKRESNQLSLVALRNKNALDSLTNQQAVAKQNALQRLMSDPGMTDPMAREKAMLSNPLLMQDGMSAQKSRIENENAQAQARERGTVADKNSYELKMKHATQAISDIASLPNPEAALRSLEAHRKAGDLDEQKYQSVLATLQPAMQDPAQFSKWKRTMVLNIMDAKDRLSSTAPKPSEVRLGNRVVMIDTNPDSPTYKQEVTSAQIGVSPDTVANNATSRANNAASLSVQMRGQDKTDSRARDANNLTKEANATVYDADRGILINKATGLVRPAATMDGKPVGIKDKGLNDTQSKALLFGTRMQEADKALATLEKGGTKERGYIKRTVEGTLGLVPFVGDNLANAGGTLTNFTQSEAQQQVEQAQRDFLNAILRRESGAVIGPSEFDSGAKQYFPQPGDGEKVIKQKARNRQLAIQGVLNEVPAQSRASITPSDPAGDIRSQADAILKGK